MTDRTPKSVSDRLRRTRPLFRREPDSPQERLRLEIGVANKRIDELIAIEKELKLFPARFRATTGPLCYSRFGPAANDEAIRSSVDHINYLIVQLLGGADFLKDALSIIRTLRVRYERLRDSLERLLILFDTDE